MKKKTKMLLVSALAIGMSLGVAGAAAGSTNVAQKIAEKFNINAEEVQKVIDENGGGMNMGKGAGMENRLSGLATEGKITEDQKAALLKKHEEMRSEMDGLTESQREAKRVEHKAEMKTWMESHGIDTSLFPQEGPGRRGGGRGMGMHNR